MTSFELFRRAADGARSRRFDVELLDAHRFAQTLEVGRFCLGNGLVVLLAVDPRAEIFSYQTWMRVGSKHEDPHKTGLAHLVEHLMFKATEQHAAGYFDRELECRGAESNAATWVDWTYYHETLAHRDDNFTRVLELESDRLQGLRLDEANFSSELLVVQNERRMTVDDSVMGSLGESLTRTAFTTHGYRWPTIGFADSLERLTLKDARDFYQMHYAPDRAVLVVAGAIDVEETLSAIAEAYGALKPSGARFTPGLPEPEQTAERRVELERPSQTRYVTLAYRIPGQLDPTRAALEAASEILFVGDNARLYRALVTDARLASEVEGYLTPFAESGLCEINLALRPGVDVDSVVERVDRELDQLDATLHQSDLTKAKNGLELAFYNSLRDADGFAEALGHFEVAHGDYRHAFAERHRIEQVDLEAVASACRSVFLPSRRTIGVVHPSGPS